MLLEKLESEIDSKINLAIGKRLNEVLEIQQNLTRKIIQLEKNNSKSNGVTSPAVGASEQKRTLVIRSALSKRMDEKT